MDIKDKIKIILKESFLLNVIGNESNNVKKKQILNMTILIKNYYLFYVFSKSRKNKSLNTIKNIC